MWEMPSSLLLSKKKSFPVDHHVAAQKKHFNFLHTAVVLFAPFKANKAQIVGIN